MWLLSKGAEDRSIWRGENWVAERPPVITAEFRIKWRPEAAWLYAQGHAETQRSWKMGQGGLGVEGP